MMSGWSTRGEPATLGRPLANANPRQGAADLVKPWGEPPPARALARPRRGTPRCPARSAATPRARPARSSPWSPSGTRHHRPPEFASDAGSGVLPVTQALDHLQDLAPGG